MHIATFLTEQWLSILTIKGQSHFSLSLTHEWISCHLAEEDKAVNTTLTFYHSVKLLLQTRWQNVDSNSHIHSTF